MASTTPTARLPRLFIAPERLQPPQPTRLRGAEHHYLSRVLRLAVGDPILLLDGAGRRATARLTHATAEELELSCEKIETIDESSGPRITLYMALIKGERHDWVIEKATELGAQKIISLTSHRSVPEVRGESAMLKKQQRWQRIAKAAAQQCRRIDIPEVTPPLPFSAIRESTAELRLLLYEGSAPPIAAILNYSAAPGEIALLIGPEGGLTEDEINLGIEVGFLPCSLGQRILRAETAAVAGLALLQCGKA